MTDAERDPNHAFWATKLAKIEAGDFNKQDVIDVREAYDKDGFFPNPTLLTETRRRVLYHVHQNVKHRLVFARPRAEDCGIDPLEDLFRQVDFKTLFDVYQGIMHPQDLALEGLWVVRLYDGMDGEWCDASAALTPHEALKEWFRQTKGGEEKTKYDDVDYFRIFPAATVMKFSDGHGVMEGEGRPEPDPLIFVNGKRRRPPWRFDLAAQLLSCMEPEFQKAGWHCGITGSVFHKGESTHDLDVIIYPRNAAEDIDKDKAREVFKSLGMKQMYTVEQVHEGWRSRGITDTKHVEVWRWHHYRIDFFFLR